MYTISSIKEPMASAIFSLYIVYIVRHNNETIVNIDPKFNRQYHLFRHRYTIDRILFNMLYVLFVKLNATW